ncbi:MAG: hypothetical protein ACI8Y4_001207 [Candidatus Poriferisodalaceae bacterium]
MEQPGLTETVRLRLGDAVRGLLVGSEIADVSTFSEPLGDPGLLGPDSVAWRVHGDIGSLVGGVRALLLQTMHPLAMAGVAEHSDYKNDPFGRLQRTAGYIGVTTFANTAAAQQMIAKVRSVHEHVHGTAPDGRCYSATDPELLRWVHATEVDSFLTSVQAFGSAQLSRDDADRYLREMSVIGAAMGATRVPTTEREMRAYWREVRPELRAGTQAREAARWLVSPPLPLAGRPAYAVLLAAAVGTLPGHVRRALRLPRVPVVDTLAVRPAARALVRVLGWSLGESPIAEAAAARAAGTPLG